MGHRYTVLMENQTIVADATLVIIRSASAIATRASLLKILRASVSQNGTGTAQQLGIMLGQKASAFGTYTAATPLPHAIGGAASGITGSTSGAAAGAGTDATAEGAGTFTSLISEGFNNLAGWLWVPTEDERILVPPDTAIALKLRGTPTTLTGWNAALTFEELN